MLCKECRPVVNSVVSSAAAAALTPGRQTSSHAAATITLSRDAFLFFLAQERENNPLPRVIYLLHPPVKKYRVINLFFFFSKTPGESRTAFLPGSIFFRAAIANIPFFFSHNLFALAFG